VETAENAGYAERCGGASILCVRPRFFLKTRIQNLIVLQNAPLALRDLSCVENLKKMDDTSRFFNFLKVGR
jgi:hypothetical protein